MWVGVSIGDHHHGDGQMKILKGNTKFYVYLPVGQVAKTLKLPHHNCKEMEIQIFLVIITSQIVCHVCYFLLYKIHEVINTHYVNSCEKTLT